MSTQQTSDNNASTSLQFCSNCRKEKKHLFFKGGFKTCSTCRKRMKTAYASCEHKKYKKYCSICSPQTYIAHLSRVRMNGALKSKKTKSSIEYVGCNKEQLMKHIESQFKPGMTWDNFGKKWEIDHIIPLKYNNPTLEQVIQRLHYKNTQPLWKTENRIKSNKYVG